MEKMWAELEAAPRCDLFGVVRGEVGAGQSAGDRLWELMIDLKPWKMGDQPTQNTTLTARKHVAKGKLDSMMKSLPAGAVVTMKARVVVDGVCDWPQALVDKIVSIGTDRSVLGGKPAPPLKDPVLGTFKPDPTSGDPTARITWGAKRIPISLQDDKHGSPEPALRHARTLASGHEKSKRDVEKFLVAKVYALWRETWTLEDDRPLTEQQWLKKIRPRRVQVDADGRFFVTHEDSDLFGGHLVVVEGRVGRRIRDFDLIG